MPLALADAISGLEAVPLAAARVLVFLGEAAADSFGDDPVEELGEAEGGAAAGAEVEVGDSDTAPDSITAFLLLRVGLLVAAVVSLLASVLAGSVAAVSEVFLLFFLFFFETVSLGDDVVLSEAAVAVSAVVVSAAGLQPVVRADRERGRDHRSHRGVRGGRVRGSRIVGGRSRLVVYGGIFFRFFLLLFLAG